MRTSGITMPVRITYIYFSAAAELLTLITALGHDKAQSIIDQITSAYESGGPPPGGFGFGPQHLGAPPPPAFGGPPMGFGGPPMPPPGFGEYDQHVSKRYCANSFRRSTTFPSRPRLPSIDASWWTSLPAWWDAPSRS